MRTYNNLHCENTSFQAIIDKMNKSLSVLTTWAYLILNLGVIGSTPLAYAVTTPPNISIENASLSSTEEDIHDTRIHAVDRAKPNWGLELSTSPNAFGGQALTQEQGTHPAVGFSLQGEYQPAFIQDYGVLGVGASLATYPIFGASATSRTFSLLAAGGQVRYQARYFRGQPLVPVIGYAFEYMSYAFSNGKSGALLTNGPVLGLWFLLNILDPNSAAQFYVDSKVARTYLVFEARALAGQDANIAISGPSYYFGLRFEF